MIYIFIRPSAKLQSEVGLVFRAWVIVTSGMMHSVVLKGAVICKSVPNLAIEKEVWNQFIGTHTCFSLGRSVVMQVAVCKA